MKLVSLDWVQEGIFRATWVGEELKQIPLYSFGNPTPIYLNVVDSFVQTELITNVRQLRQLRKQLEAS